MLRMTEQEALALLIPTPVPSLELAHVLVSGGYAGSTVLHGEILTAFFL